MLGLRGLQPRAFLMRSPSETRAVHMGSLTGICVSLGGLTT